MDHLYTLQQLLEKAKIRQDAREYLTTIGEEKKANDHVPGEQPISQYELQVLRDSLMDRDELESLLDDLIGKLIGVENDYLEGIKSLLLRKRLKKIVTKSRLVKELEEAGLAGQKSMKHLIDIRNQLNNIIPFDKIGSSYKETQVLKKIVASDMHLAKNRLQTQLRLIDAFNKELKDVIRILIPFEDKIKLKIRTNELSYISEYLTELSQSNKPEAASKSTEKALTSITQLLHEINTSRKLLKQKIQQYRDDLLDIIDTVAIDH